MSAGRGGPRERLQVVSELSLLRAGSPGEAGCAGAGGGDCPFVVVAGGKGGEPGEGAGVVA